MLSDREREVIKLVLQGELTKNQICEKVGYKNRASIYKILEKEEAKEYMQKLADRAVGEAVAILKANSNTVARRLVEIAKGTANDVDKQTIYATLNAINSVLEKSGLSSKNITLQDNRDKETTTTEEDILAGIEEIDNNVIEIDNIKKAN